MNNHLIRVYQELNYDDVKPHLLIYGDLNGNCAACNQIDIKLNDLNCPGCSTEFKYITFRNPHTQIPKMKKLSTERPGMKIIDFDDWKKWQGVNKARDFLK